MSYKSKWNLTYQTYLTSQPPAAFEELHFPWVLDVHRLWADCLSRLWYYHECLTHTHQVCFYLNGFKEVQVVQEVLLSVVQPDGRRFTDDFLYHLQHLWVWDRHKVLQTVLAPLPGTHVPQVDPEASEEDLRPRNQNVSGWGDFDFQDIINWWRADHDGLMGTFTQKTQTLLLWFHRRSRFRVNSPHQSSAPTEWTEPGWTLNSLYFAILWNTNSIELHGFLWDWACAERPSPSPGWCRPLWSAGCCVRGTRRSSAERETESRCLGGNASV